MVGCGSNVKVLSLFDGMSCCRLALEKLDISVEKYYASEIDKYAIEVTQANYPDTEQLGDVTAWETWELDWASIDLVTGGFPCQAWSLAGKQLGDKDERGKLFWTMLDVMAKVMEHNPKAFYLMENVKMKKEFESYITYHTEQALPNVYKYLINSALVSAQSRQRYYWTNIQGVEQPEDRGIVLRDILEHETDESHFVGADLHKNYQGGKQLNPTYKSQANTIHDSSDKSATLAAGTHGYANGYVENPTADLVGKGGKKMLKEDIQKATALMARDYKGWNTYGMTGVRTKPEQMLELRKDEANSVSSVSKDSLEVKEELTWRKLTPNECMALQTVRSDYLMPISNTQKYKLLGNGWTVEVIAHIFTFMQRAHNGEHLVTKGQQSLDL